MSQEEMEANCSDPNRDLEKAAADLVAAEEELAQATRDVTNAEAELIAAEKARQHELQVQVLYDGVKKPFEIRRQELVKKLLDEAIKAFGPIPTPNHLLSLFTEAGMELKDADTIEQAGVKPCETLLLRPSKVKGGA